MTVSTRNSTLVHQVTVTHDEVNDWILVRFTGQLNVDNSVAAMRQGAQMCREKGCRSILFDMRDIELIGNFMAAHDLAKNARQKTGIDSRWKCAIIYDPRTYPAERAEFMETTARNWGQLSFRMFSVEQLAIDWLRG